MASTLMTLATPIRFRSTSGRPVDPVVDRVVGEIDDTLPGSVWWDPATCSYGAELHLFPPGRACGPAPLRLGGRVGRYVTMDGLGNALALAGFRPCGSGPDRMERLRRTVVDRFGEVEVVAVPTTTGGRLTMILQDGRRLSIHPDLSGVAPDAGPGWDPERVRALVRRIWSEGWGGDEELFALVLGRQLDGLGQRALRIGADRLCEWMTIDASADLADLAADPPATSDRPVVLSDGPGR